MLPGTGDELQVKKAWASLPIGAVNKADGDNIPRDALIVVT